MVLVAVAAATIVGWQERRRYVAVRDLVSGLGPVGFVRYPYFVTRRTPISWPGAFKFRGDWAAVVALRADRQAVEAIAARLDRSLLDNDPVVAGSCLAALIEVGYPAARGAIPSLRRVARSPSRVILPTIQNSLNRRPWLGAQLQAVYALGLLAQDDSARDGLLELLWSEEDGIEETSVVRSALAELSYYQDAATKQRVLDQFIRRIELYKILAVEPPGVLFTIHELERRGVEAMSGVDALLRRARRPEPDPGIREAIYSALESIALHSLTLRPGDPRRNLSAEELDEIAALLAEASAHDPDAAARKEASRLHAMLLKLIDLIRDNEELLRILKLDRMHKPPRPARVQPAGNQR